MNTSKVETTAEVVKFIQTTKKEHKWKPAAGDHAWGTGGSNVLCGFVDERGVPRYDMYPCHQPIKGYKNAKILWSCFGARTKAVVTKAFHEWLCYNSPWAKIGAIPEERDEFDFSWKEGFIFDNLKVPANSLHNFLVASRMAAEWPHHIQVWYDLVTKQDLDPTFAFLFLTVFQVLNNDAFYRTTAFDKGNTSCLAFADKYDWPLDMARCGEEYLINFLTGQTPGLSKTHFFPTAHTEPVNSLWGELYEPSSRKKRYVLRLFQLYGEQFGRARSKKETVSKFDFQPKETTEASKPEFLRAFEPKEVLEIARLEQDRLFKIIGV